MLQLWELGQGQFEHKQWLRVQQTIIFILLFGSNENAATICYDHLAILSTIHISRGFLREQEKGKTKPGHGGTVTRTHGHPGIKRISKKIISYQVPCIQAPHFIQHTDIGQQRLLTVTSRLRVNGILSIPVTTWLTPNLVLLTGQWLLTVVEVVACISWEVRGTQKDYDIMPGYWHRDWDTLQLCESKTGYTFIPCVESS